MEYAIVGSVLSLLISMKFTDFKSKEVEERLKSVESKVELVTTAVQNSEAEAPKKTLMIVAPVARAVKELQAAIGVAWGWRKYLSTTMPRIRLQQFKCWKMLFLTSCLIAMLIGYSALLQNLPLKNHL